MTEDTDHLHRYINAQGSVYPKVIQELQDADKQSHWMWYIFPQISGLGYSSTAQYYAIKNADEAREYLAHPVLGMRIVECTKILIAHCGSSAIDIMGDIDAVKLRSSMTLFAHVTDSDSVFQQALDKYFDGELDHGTLDILSTL